MSHVGESEELEKHIAKVSSVPVKYIVQGGRLIPELTHEQKNAVLIKNRKIKDLEVPEFVTRGRPYCGRMLEELEQSCAKQIRSADSSDRSKASYFGRALSYMMPTPRRDTPFTVTMDALKRIHRQLFESEGHSDAFDYTKKSIKPGEIISSNHKADFCTMDIAAADSEFPQLSLSGMEQAQKLRNEQISPLKLDKNYPTFVLHFPDSKSLDPYQNFCIPLSLEQAKKLAQLNPTPRTHREISRQEKIISDVLEDISRELEANGNKGVSALFDAEDLRESLTYRWQRDNIVKTACGMLPEILRYKCLPSAHIKRETQREIGEFNNSLIQSKTMSDVCKAIGRHIPRLIQIHPFPHGNRYIFAQYAREILLHYGYPSMAQPNLKLLGMIGEEELADLLLRNIAAYSAVESECQTKYSEFDTKPSQKLSSYTEKEILPTVRQLETMRKEHNLKPACISEEEQPLNSSVGTSV